MSNTLNVKIGCCLLIFCTFLIQNLLAQSSGSTGPLPNKAGLTYDEINDYGKFHDRILDLDGQITSKNIYEKRLAYNMITIFDYVQAKSLAQYEKETDPVCKRIIALIGYNLHPTSLKWKTRFLDNFPRTDKERHETFGDESYGGSNFEIYTPFLCTLGDIAVNNRKALLLLLNIQWQSTGGLDSEIGSGIIYNVANKSPRYFLRELKKVSMREQDFILSALAFGSTNDNFKGPFKKELDLLIKKKDKELGEFAAYCLKYMQKSIKEINNPQ